MKKSGYRTSYHIYIIFFFSLLGVLILASWFFFSLFTVQKNDGSTVVNNWPIDFTENFKGQIIFTNDNPGITQTAMAQLQEEGIGLQILSEQGQELYSYQKPAQAKTSYSNIDFLQLYRSRGLENREYTAFIGTLPHNGRQYSYILYFPFEITKVTMYLNGENFTYGKTIFLICLGATLVLILVAGLLYGFWISRNISKLTDSIKEIPQRTYLPVQKKDAFADIYESINRLDEEIKKTDQLRIQTEKLREEWIANITHDLKTPLSPIRGYAEILSEDGFVSKEQVTHYSQIILKNVEYMENLLNDLKLTYQLDSGMIPFNPSDGNIVRFLKETIIDILNTPEYENRRISFESEQTEIICSFDSNLLIRAFKNLIINAFVHGDQDLNVKKSHKSLIILVSDNGKGISAEETAKLFNRYYRGTNTEQKTEGTGLGLAITKSIIEAHGGTISVSSVLGRGTTFEVFLPAV